MFLGKNELAKLPICTTKNMMQKKCQFCSHKFQITEKDKNFYEKMDLLEPELCPDCRQQHRLCFRNELNLYKRKCDFTGKEMISIYSPDKPVTVYEHSIWYSDKWDALEFGRDFNFNQPFFEQFGSLLNSVPKINLLVLGDNENSEYTHDNYRLKNCYLVFDGEQGYDCLYGETFVLIKSCIDFYQLNNCEFCYETVRCEGCYNLQFSSFCNNCSDSYFLQDCIGCRNCFGCCNLKQKQYYVLNEPYSKGEYYKKLESFNLNSHNSLEDLKKSSFNFFKKFPKKAVRGLMNENTTGDYLYNSKDSFDCYDCMDLRDCKYCTNCQLAANDCYDIDIWGDRMQFCYNCEVTGAGAEKIVASYYAALNASNVFHSFFCLNNVSNLFGCVGLTQKSNCILNKQYSKEEFEELFPRIIEHMKHTGEWGQFFPPSLSPFGYNETVANDFYPLTKEEALSKGFKWKDLDPKEFKSQNYKIPDIIEDVPDQITNEILACEQCDRNYRIEDAELRYYRRNKLPIPRKCFYCRHQARKRLKNPRKLWERKCMKCTIDVQSSYSPEREEIVYCEKCYQENLV